MDEVYPIGEMVKIVNSGVFGRIVDHIADGHFGRTGYLVEIEDRKSFFSHREVAPENDPIHEKIKNFHLSALAQGKLYIILVEEHDDMKAIFTNYPWHKIGSKVERKYPRVYDFIEAKDRA